MLSKDIIYPIEKILVQLTFLKPILNFVVWN